MRGRFRDVERSDVTIGAVRTEDEFEYGVGSEDVRVVRRGDRNSGEGGGCTDGAIDGV